MTRLTAFAFGELVEASATLASLGEARSERVRRTYSDVVREAVASVGGRELKATDDEMLAAFDSATDAVRFACSVQRRCERESRRSAERLDVRIGIDVGEAPSLDDVEAIGGVPAAARARRLARAAAAGSVVASSLVAELAAGAEWRLAPMGLLDQSGSEGPLQAYEVLSERRTVAQAPLPAELEVGADQSPFVGREIERERLQAVWRTALSGSRQLAFVAGEPGIGKTRLVAEFAREAHENGANVLWGRSFEEALTPYQPFVQALQHHIRSTPPELLREQVGVSGGTLARLLPELTARLAVPPAGVEDPEGERFRLFEAIGRLFVAASAEQPVLLVLDDLQWAEQGTLQLLKHLMRDIAPAPLLVLGTYRHSEVGSDHPLALVQADVERDRIVERIELAGLDEDEIASLVGELVGWEPPPEIVRGLIGETDGNPFFLEEIVRHLEQLGLSADAERFARVQATVSELGVPARVRELVGRRVQRLSAGARAALSAAAVIGSEFASDVLAEVLGLDSEQELVGALDEAVAGRLLVESTEQLGRYSFSHALIQQALYEEQTVNRRATLHGQIAAALEARSTTAHSIPAEIAYHYGRAGNRHAAKVARYGRAAGEHALELLAYESAVQGFTSALGALDLLAEDDPRERAELLVLLGSAQTRAGDVNAARQTLRRAAELSAAVGAWQTLARAALGFGGGGIGFGGVWENYATVDEELVRLLEQALDACPPHDSHERVRLLGRLAQALYWSSDKERALALSEESLAAARRLGDPASLAYALDSRNVVLWSPDHLDEGQAIAEEMLQLGRDLGDRDIQLEALAWLITDGLERGSIALVDELIDEHARIAAELRQPYHLWFTEAMRAMRAHLEGRFTEANERCERALAYGDQAHANNALQVHLAQAMFFWLDQGRAEELLDQLANFDVAWPSEMLHTATALCLAGLDRREEALEHVAYIAERGFASLPRDHLWMMTLVTLGRVVAHFDDPTYADDLYQLLRPYPDRICIIGGPVVCLGPVSRILGMLARADGRPDDALDHFADALERSHALGSPPLVARTQLEAAKAHVLRGQRDDAATADRLLGEALAIASSLGMEKLRHDIEALQSSLGRTALV